MKVKTSQLSGVQLDWAVAHIQGYAEGPNGSFWITEDDCVDFKPSTDWAQGGPIIERETISVAADTADMFDSFLWFASVDDILVDPDEAIGVRGPTLLIAAMRCYVASKLGDEIEVPDELKQVLDNV